MSGDLDSILNGDEQPEAAVEPVVEPETPAEPEATPEPVAEEEPKGPTRDEKGRFAPKGETESASPAPVSEPQLDHAALLGERRRRQEAEDRIRALEAQIAQPAPTAAPQPAVQQAQPFEFNEDLYWSNPQQFLDSFKQSILQEVQGAIPQIVTGVTLDRAEAAARARYEDYDQARDAFYRVAIADQTIAQKAMAQADPAEYAYQEGKRLLEMAQYPSLNAYIDAEVERRQAALVPVQQQPAPVIPESLADAPAAGLVGHVAQAPLSLNDILKR